MLLYVGLTLGRTRPTSATPSPGDLARWPVGQTSYPPNYPLMNTHRSSNTFTTHSYVEESYNNYLTTKNSRIFIIPRKTFVHINTISTQLYTLPKHVHSLQESTPNSVIPTCHRKRPPPVRPWLPRTTVHDPSRA